VCVPWEAGVFNRSKPPYRDKKVVGVFVRFRATSSQSAQMVF
jgi:hypothetical protein